MKKHNNQHLGRTENNEPTLTDQSAVNTTDINIIVTQFLKTGQQPTGQQKHYADFTHIPTDLKEFIEMGRSINEHRANLPDVLRDIPIEYLVRMTDEQINAMLKPPEAPADKKDDTKP